MLALPAPFPEKLRPAGVLSAALMHPLARDEAARRRPERLTGAGPATWGRFRGRLTPNHLAQLLFEDASVVQPVPFDTASLLGPSQPGPDALPAGVAGAWLQQIGSLDLAAPGGDYLAAQARLLGVPSRLARVELHQVKPHQRVLELPGTGGQPAHHVDSTQEGITLQQNFLVACESWRELALAGIAALDRGAPDASFARLDPDLTWHRDEARRHGFEFVFGLHPDKGGRFAEARLAEWFPNARIVLV